MSTNHYTIGQISARCGPSTRRVRFYADARAEIDRKGAAMELDQSGFDAQPLDRGQEMFQAGVSEDHQKSSPPHRSMMVLVGSVAVAATAAPLRPRPLGGRNCR